MPEFRLRYFVLLFFAACGAAAAQDKTSFPTATEIDLMVTQADRALQQYKPLVDQHERLLGAKAREAGEKDREVVRALEMAIKGFRENPQAFNSQLGFVFFEWIDDADRNALLCASGALTEATTSLMDGKVARARELADLAHSCSDAATLIYTVSENAGALYTRYVSGAEKMAKDGAEIAKKCAGVLKNSMPQKKQ